MELVLVLVVFVEPAKPKPPPARGARPAALDTRKLAVCYVFCYTIPINVGLWEVNTVFQAVEEWGWSIEVSVGAGCRRWGLGGGRSSWMPRLLVLGCRDCSCPPLWRSPRPEVLYSQGPVADPNAQMLMVQLPTWTVALDREQFCGLGVCFKRNKLLHPPPHKSPNPASKQQALHESIL